MKTLVTNVHEMYEISDKILKRNADIRQGNYTVVDCGCLNFGDIYLIGFDHASAAVALKQALPSCKDYRDLAEALRDLEYLFYIQVWDSTEFDLRKVLEG